MADKLKTREFDSAQDIVQFLNHGKRTFVAENTIPNADTPSGVKWVLFYTADEADKEEDVKTKENAKDK